MNNMIFFLSDRSGRAKEIGIIIFSLGFASYLLISCVLLNSVNQIVDDHFTLMQDEGYLSENIEKSIINDVIERVGPNTNINISGTNEKVVEGENLFLKVNVSPRTFPGMSRNRVGMRKYVLNK